VYGKSKSSPEGDEEDQSLTGRNNGQRDKVSDS
jgi:hypothetical protein